MNYRLKALFDRLNKYLGTGSAPNLNGEYSVYQLLHGEILSEIRAMETNDVVQLINELSDRQINQIVTIIAEIIAAHPQTIHTFRIINNDRKIYLLNDELKQLGLI